MSEIESLQNSPKFPNALCAKLEDKNYFFPDGKVQEAERLPDLQAICSVCLHREECAEYAIKEKIPFGIWGGTTLAMRRRFFDEHFVIAERKGNAKFVRKMHDEGCTPEHIASYLRVNLPYVREMIRRYEKMKMKGAIQSNLNIEKLPKELRLSLGLVQ
jgi:hypothetical protein